MNIKLGLLFSSYGPYHLARVQGLVNSPQFAQYRVTAIELARTQEEYPWQAQINDLPFPLITVINDRPLEQINFLHLWQRLNRTLNWINPDVLAIAGYARPSMLSALAWCHRQGKPAILFSETTEQDFLRFTWRERIKRGIICQYNSALVGGSPHKRYLVKLGMPAEAVFLGYDVVGNHTFHPQQIRELPPPLKKTYFLAINRFVPKKNLAFLIAAYHAYRQIAEDKAWDLVLCGDGEMRPQLEQQIVKLGLQQHIHLPGFLQQEELLPYFAHAACFIHSSTQEQWGLVVNEAMASGLPVLVSNQCGCFEDLVLEGINGFGFDPQNQQQLTDLMLKFSSGELDLEQMGRASLAHIEMFSPELFASSFIDAVEYAIAHSRLSLNYSI